MTAARPLTDAERLDEIARDSESREGFSTAGPTFSPLVGELHAIARRAHAETADARAHAEALRKALGDAMQHGIELGTADPEWVREARALLSSAPPVGVLDELEGLRAEVRAAREVDSHATSEISPADLWLTALTRYRIVRAANESRGFPRKANAPREGEGR